VRHRRSGGNKKHRSTSLLAERFGDPERFSGAYDQPAGWHEAGATAGHRRAGADDDTAGASLKTLWLKARRPDAALLLRPPPRHPPPACRAPQPLPPMGVLPVKLT